MNLRRFLSYSLVAVGAMLFSLALQASAAFTQPSTAPPNADADAPLTVGATAQAKVGGLLLNTGGAANGLIVQSGNVGIGTASPLSKLHVGGLKSATGPTSADRGIELIEATDNAAGLSIGNYSASPYGMWLQSVDTRTGNSGTFPLILNPTGGNVGIGTASPTDKFVVNGAVKSTASLTAHSASTAVMDYSGGARLLAYGTDATTLGTWTFLTKSSNSSLTTNAMTILGNGNVGIGTTTPGSLLDLSSSAPIITLRGTGGGALGLAFNYNSTEIGSIKATYVSGELASVAGFSGYGGFHTFSTDGSERMRITAAGNVGIGTTAPSNRLEVKKEVAATNTLNNVVGIELASTGTAAAGLGPAIQFLNEDSAGGQRGAGQIGSVWKSAANAAPQSNLVFLDNAGTNLVTMQYGGNVGIGTNSPGYKLTVAGTAWVTSGSWSGSDIRWKKDIQPISGALDKVLQLSGVSYNWRQTEFPQNKFDDKTHLGLIAQDVEKVVPELVTTGPDGYKGVDYNGFAALLINSIHEQQSMIVNQQKEIDDLKAAVKALQQK